MKSQAHCKKTNPFMNAILFVAYYLGYYKYQIRTVFRFLLIISIIFAVFYSILFFFDLSLHIHRGRDLWFIISR
ncbi:MAG: hypothetical protein ACK4VN_06720 [Bacteroidales bacterium]